MNKSEDEDDWKSYDGTDPVDQILQKKDTP
jgi:hypothetical protein